jgi:FkbM family methyltransferase
MPNLTRLAAGMAARVLRRQLSRVTAGDRAWLAARVMQGRFDPATVALADFCVRAIHTWKNKQYAVMCNGEAALLERLRPFAPRVLVDAGANVGDWSLAACEVLPEANVHAFEISASTAAELIRKTARVAGRVTVNTVGLGDAERTVTLYSAPRDSTIASTVRGAITYSAADEGLTGIEEMQAPVTTGDAYLDRHGIVHVDMLKIDVEGAEFSVLRGFASAFARGAIDLVQFEYGPLNLTTRDFLGDFCAFFAQHGYAVGKLYPEGVAFKPYAIDDEDFVGPNYIACRAARADLIAALECPVPRLA